MHFPIKQSELMIDLAATLRDLSDVLCNQIEPAEEGVVTSPTTDIFADLPPTRLLSIVEGEVDYFFNGKLVLHFTQGDILGLPRSLNLPQGRFACSSPVTFKAYERDAWVTAVNADLKSQRNWAHFLLCSISLYELAFAQELRSEFQPSAGFLNYRAGDTIIQQGDTAHKVYTLLEGSADAVCDGVKVGEINANEIFGALAVFTRQPRIASVIATSDCTVLAVRKEEFITLIEHQPQICLGLIEEMAAKINQLNTHLLQLKNQPIDK
jgi:CRP/FNR family cyclic AMP-dependent transcriptional regulator